MNQRHCSAQSIESDFRLLPEQKMTYSVHLSRSTETLGYSCHHSASAAPAFLWRGGHLQQIIMANCSYSHILLAGIADLKEQSQGLPTPC